MQLSLTAVLARLCGQSWLDCYIESLNESDKSKVNSNEASNFHRLGDGKRAKSVKLPAVIGHQPVTIQNMQEQEIWQAKKELRVLARVTRVCTGCIG